MRSGKFLSLSEKLKQSELTSKLALLCTLLSSPYFFIFHYFKLHFAGNMIIFFSGAYLISFALSCLKHLHSAKILLIFNASLLLFFYSLLLGKESGAFLVFFSIVPIPIILFENKKKYLILLCSFMPIIFSYLLEYLDYSFLFQQADINPDYLRIIFKFAMSTSFSFSLFASWMFYNSYKEKELRILRKNQELERANKKIKEKTKKETELKTIHQLQLEFLPKISKTIPGFERYQFDVLFTPSSREITGDFYDFYKVGKKIRGFVGDVQGKGARAGFIAVNYLAMLKQFRGQNIPLYSLMETLNVEACNLHINKNFCAGFLWEIGRAHV